MITPQYGDRVRVVARVGGIYNMPEGVWLKAPGDEAEVVWSPFWAGELECERLRLWTRPEPEPDPEPEPKTRKRKVEVVIAEEPEDEEEVDD